MYLRTYMSREPYLRVMERFLLVMCAVSLWCRVVYMLRYNMFMGRLWGVISKVLGTLIVYFCYYLVQIMIWSAVVQLSFPRMDEFHRYSEAMKNMVYASLGNFDFAIFEDSGYNQYWATTFFLVFMITNVGLFISLFMAIVVSLYSEFANRAMIYHMIDTLEVRPVAEADHEYSSLVSLPAPLNVLHLFLAPILLTRTDPEFWNTAILWFAYLPILVVTTALFFAYSVLISPLCLLKVFFHKMIMIFVYSKSHRVQRADKFMMWVMFAITGPFRIFINIFTDTWSYMRHCVHTDLKRTKLSFQDKSLTKENLRTTA